MLLFVVAVSLVVLCGVFRWKHRKLYRLASALGTDPRALPLFGIAHLFVGNGEVLMRGIQTVGRHVLKNEGIMSIWIAHRFFVVIADPVEAEHVAKYCLEKDEIMKKCMKPVIGNCNFAAPVPIWRVRRKNLMPPFSPRNLKQFVKVFAAQSEVLADQLRPALPHPVPLFDYCIRYTMETLFQTALGVQLNVQSTPHHPFADGLEKILSLVGERFLKPWLQVDCLYKLLPRYRLSQKLLAYENQTVDEVIQNMRKQMQSENQLNKEPKAVKCLLEQLMQVEYSDEEMREETLAVTAAGTDTSAAAAVIVAAMLASHPDVQEKVHAELTKVFENDETVTPDHLSRLKYLDAVIKETLRLYPPAPIITRQTDKEFQLPSGVVLPAGCKIVLHLWAINRNSKYWGPDADQFRPERFLHTSPPLKHPAQFASFSLGPRNCVGYKYALMSLQTLFATMLRRYRFLPVTSEDVAGQECSGDDLRLSYGVIIKDVDFTVKLQLRAL